MRKTLVSLALPVLVAGFGAAAIAQTMPTSQPKFLHVVRQRVKLGRSAEHSRWEAGWPAAFEKAKSPDTYIALESVTGPAEVWYVIPFSSHAAYGESMAKQDADPVLSAGYRIEHAGRSVCYVTDTDHVPGRPDENVLELVAGADLVIYDSTYTDEELPARVGWGHSTWREGLRLVRRAGARRLVVFRHDPEHDDEAMAAIERELTDRSEGGIVAREGLRLEL